MTYYSAKGGEVLPRLNYISFMQKHQEQQQQVANMQVREQQNTLLEKKR